VDAATEFLHGILKEQIQSVPVPFVEEDRISGIAAKNYMVDGAGIMDAVFMRHVRMIVANVRKSSLTPLTAQTTSCSLIFAPSRADCQVITISVQSI